MGRGANSFCYVDDVLVTSIMANNANVENKLRMLNAVKEHIAWSRKW